jgi:hypothetical protein
MKGISALKRLLMDVSDLENEQRNDRDSYQHHHAAVSMEEVEDDADGGRDHSD